MDCEACGSRTLAYTKGELNFLNSFQHWHLARPGHKLAAALRQEAICQALHDAAVSSAAAAQAAARQTAAAASAQPSATQLELERGAAAAAHAVEEAHAALLRAQEANVLTTRDGGDATTRRSAPRARYAGSRILAGATAR